MTGPTGLRSPLKHVLQRWNSCANNGQPTCPMLNKDFKEFIALLNSTGVEYLVVGGYALAAHGHPRYTGDIDIWVGVTTENVQKLLSALHAFGFGNVGLTQDDFLVPEAMVQLGYPPARIDLLTTIDGVSFADCYPQRMEVLVSDLTLPIIDLASFIANKRASGRPKDLADLASLDTEAARSKPTSAT